MLIPICQVGEVQAYSGDVTITPEMLEEWVGNFGKSEKVPIGMGHLTPDFTLADTDKTPYCWISGLHRAGDYLLAELTDWTEEGKQAALGNAFKNFSIETTGGGEDRIKYVAALGAYDSAVDFKKPNGERFQPWDFTRGSLGEEGRLMLAAALGYAMPYKSPPKRITDLFADEKGPKVWASAFNSAYEKYKDEARASKIAWGAVENAGYAKGEDGKWRKSKSKTAAIAAAEGGQEMAEEQAAKAAEEKKSVLAKLTSWLSSGDAPPAKPAAAAEAEPTEQADVKALAAEVSDLKAQLVKQRGEFAAASLMNDAEKLCLAAKAEPRFVPVVAQLLAALPPDYEVVLDEAGEHKTTARVAFGNLLLAKGTAKLEDPIILSKPPAKKSVARVVPETGTTPEDKQKEIAAAAKKEAIAAGKGDDPEFVKSLIMAKMAEAHTEVSK